MTTLLPIIEQLADAADDAARADWLLRCPLSVLMSYEFTIRNRLRSAGFAAGVDYLDSELSALRAVRNEFGDLGYNRRHALGRLRTDIYMLRVYAAADDARSAEGGDG